MAQIDPSIPLSYRPPQIQNPVDALSRSIELKGEMQRQQMGELQLQQTQMDMQDQRTMRAIMAQHAGTLEDARPSMAGRVSPKAFLGLQNSVIELAKNRAGLAKTQADTAKEENEFFGRL